MAKYIKYKEYCIPTGKSVEDVNVRRKIIEKFYERWFKEHPTKKIKNVVLNEFIHVNKKSKKETIAHAGKFFVSTMYILNLDIILEIAIPTKEIEVKGESKSQKPFHKMLIMEAVVPELAKYGVTGKLVIGIKRTRNTKFQYCLTAQ